MAGLCEGGNEPSGSLKPFVSNSTRVCVRIRRPEFECSGPQLEGPEFECSGPQLEGPEFEYSELSLKSALAKVTEDNWRKACEHVEKVEQFYWEKDGLVDEISDRFVINLDDTDTDEELSGGEESEFEEEESAAAANSWSLEGVSTIPPSRHRKDFNFHVPPSNHVRVSSTNFIQRSSKYNIKNNENSVTAAIVGSSEQAPTFRLLSRSRNIPCATRYWEPVTAGQVGEIPAKRDSKRLQNTASRFEVRASLFHVGCDVPYLGGEIPAKRDSKRLQCPLYTLDKPRHRWEGNIKMDLREVGYDATDWINLPQDRDRWWLMNIMHQVKKRTVKESLRFAGRSAWAPRSSGLVAVCTILDHLAR
ncbi:hypothetical protein ANN_06971 [Periplaneta americana]|uniref:Uncharacterized protein n=1 Tax=Periplaneta americana TaxID=6978 RepID=A0ABQ8THL4_PERAM|nr:hypothetical protein ANN_06971 [Periplaneta americana]